MGLFELVITLYIGVMTYLANLADLQNSEQRPAVEYAYQESNTYALIVRRMLYGLIAMIGLFGLYAVRVLLLDLPAETLEELGISPEALSPSNFIVITALTIVVCGMALLLITSPVVRKRIRTLFGRRSTYNPDSYVHLVAMVLILSLVGYLFVNFVISGGLEGVAKAVQENGVSLSSLLFQGAMFVLIALLGVGLAIRRTPQQVLQRLGLEVPNPRNVMIGILAGIVLIFLSSFLNQIWTSLVTPEQYAQQSIAAAEIDNQFNTLPAVFILALSAAIGEEILFRGALQPIFGLPLTTLFFVLFHDQYALTPAMLIILAIGFGLALLRRYVDTTSAIFAHFTYNFLPIAIVLLAPQLAQNLGLS